MFLLVAKYVNDVIADKAVECWLTLAEKAASANALPWAPWAAPELGFQIQNYWYSEVWCVVFGVVQFMVWYSLFGVCGVVWEVWRVFFDVWCGILSGCGVWRVVCFVVWCMLYAVDLFFCGIWWEVCGLCKSSVLKTVISICFQI